MSQKKIIQFLFAFSLLTPSLAFGLEGDESLMGFDSIVNELNSTRTAVTPNYQGDPFANILFHSGVGMTTSHATIQVPGEEALSGFMRGIEINLGIDLFSKNWLAEGSFRNFGKEKFSESQTSLKEFDLKLTYKNRLARRVKFRTGGGLAARYLTYMDITEEGPRTLDYTTPSSLLYLGVDAELTNAITMGAEVSYRSTMIDETADISAFDASFRVDAHF